MKKLPLITSAVVVFFTLVSCSSDTVSEIIDNGPAPVDSSANKRVLGVCFMHGESCVSTYIDLGPYEDHPNQKTADMVPAYIFPSLPAEAGGQPHPWDPEMGYNPFRLQNNVFARDGRVWQMYLITSGNINLMARPRDDIVLWGVGADRESTNRRDLYINPFTDEAEILRLVDSGDLKLTDTGLATDCPLVKQRHGDIVVNLNPRFPVCPQ